MRVLVVNAGSSSLKLSLLGPADRVEAATTVEKWSGAEDTTPIQDFLDGAGHAGAGHAGAGPPDAVGHRVVHGGTRYRSAALLDEPTVGVLESLTDLAPLHQPPALAGVAAVHRLLPGVPAVGCFDTAFHAGLPAAASTYALPAAWRERWGLRRYGFHGLSHAYAARRAAEMLALPPDEPRLVTCHLGAGASLCAVRGGRSVDTTMGFTPLEGLVMATRSGSVDPGLVLWLQRRGGLGADQVSDALEHESGLAGLTGTGGDMREVLAAADAGDPAAGAALAVYLHRLRREIAGMVAALDGLDALVFTGGVGERAPAIRAGAAAGLGFLGVRVDETANRGTGPDADITAPGAAVRTLVVAAREDIEIARQVRALLT
jgi:acetate kinase